MQEQLNQLYDQVLSDGCTVDTSNEEVRVYNLDQISALRLASLRFGYTITLTGQAEGLFIFSLHPNLN